MIPITQVITNNLIESGDILDQMTSSIQIKELKKSGKLNFQDHAANSPAANQIFNNLVGFAEMPSQKYLADNLNCSHEDNLYSAEEKRRVSIKENQSLEN